MFIFTRTARGGYRVRESISFCDVKWNYNNVETEEAENFLISHLKIRT